MTPERADAVLRAVIASITLWADELELIESVRPVPTPAVQHLLATMRQTKVSLEQLLKRG